MYSFLVVSRKYLRYGCVNCKNIGFKSVSFSSIIKSTIGNLSSFNIFYVVFFYLFCKKISKINLEGINSYKTYYNINIFFSGNLVKKTNDVFSRKKRDNQSSIVYKQNIYELYKEYYKYLNEMLLKYAPKLNNPTFLKTLIKKNY
jgi:hypothetical protein